MTEEDLRYVVFVGPHGLYTDSVLQYHNGRKWVNVPTIHVKVKNEKLKASKDNNNTCGNSTKGGSEATVGSKTTVFDPASGRLIGVDNSCDDGSDCNEIKRT